MAKKFVARIEGEGMKFSNYTRAYFKEHIRNHQGEYLDIIPKKVKRTVSDELRGYYFAGILPFIQGLDEQWSRYSVEEIHEIMKLEFNSTMLVNPIDSKKTRIVGSAMSDSCKTDDAFVFIEKIRRWVAENYGEELPDPEIYKKWRDKHFEKSPKKVEYPENNLGEPNF